MVFLLLVSDGITKAQHDERQPSPTTLLMTDVTSGDDGVVTTTSTTAVSTTAASTTTTLVSYIKMIPQFLFSM